MKAAVGVSVGSRVSIQPQRSERLTKTATGVTAMNWKRTLTTLSLGAATLTGAATGGVLSGNCRVGNQPAATFLIPYFEVDLVQPGGATTLFSVNNASAKPEIARVVLWTDWGV